MTFLALTSPLFFDVSAQNAINAEQRLFELQTIEKNESMDRDSEGACGEGKCGEGACGNMTLDSEGMVMNENRDNLPGDCPEISADVKIEVSAGRKYSEPYPGTTFGFSQHQWNVKPCSRITVTFTNDDNVRHQWMVHDLPAYLYSQSMFHLEASGGREKTGTFIVPSDHKTYLVHCDMAAHMEKGMKAQLVVGGGSGNLPGIPGITAARNPTSYPVENRILAWLLGVALSAVSFLATLKVNPEIFSRKNRRTQPG